MRVAVAVAVARSPSASPSPRRASSSRESPPCWPCVSRSDPGHPPSMRRFRASTRCPPDILCPRRRTISRANRGRPVQHQPLQSLADCSQAAPTDWSHRVKNHCRREFLRAAVQTHSLRVSILIAGTARSDDRADKSSRDQGRVGRPARKTIPRCAMMVLTSPIGLCK